MKKFLLMVVCVVFSNFLFAKDVEFTIPTNKGIEEIEMVNATRLENVKGSIQNKVNFGIGFKLKDTGDKYTIHLGDMKGRWTENCSIVLFDVDDNISFDLRYHEVSNDLYIAIVEKGD